MEIQAEKHPIQNLFDEVDEQTDDTGERNLVKDMLMSAYAIGYVKGGK